VGYDNVTVLSQLPISDDLWRSRLLIQHGLGAAEQATYEITLARVRIERALILYSVAAFADARARAH
jgi:hypothetical protein